jgi:phosphoserine aminotransferase
MITFAPGPSKVHDALPTYLQDAFNEGILSANHRGGPFMKLYQETESLMRQKLHMPEDYSLLFTSSSTENWEIVSQSIVESASFHIYSGSFGKKWIEKHNGWGDFVAAELLTPDTVTWLSLWHEGELIVAQTRIRNHKI